MKTQWLGKEFGTKALAVALVLAIAPMTMAQPGRRAERAAAAAADEQKPVKYDDLPGKIKETIDKEKGRNTVKSIYQVRKEGRDFYSVVLAARNGDEKVIRVGSEGELLSAVDEGTGTARARADARATAEEQKPVKLEDLPVKIKDTIEKERGRNTIKSIYQVKREGKEFYSVVLASRAGDEKIIRVGNEGELLSAVDEGSSKARPAAVRATDEGTQLNYDDLPGGVKTAIGHEALGYTKPVKVTKYEHRGQTVYSAVMSDGNRERIIRVFANGQLFSDDDATPEGGKEVKFDTMPHDPKVAVGREAGAAKVRKVFQFTRDAKTHYRILCDDGRTFDVTDDGTIVKAEPFEAKATATPRRAR